MRILVAATRKGVVLFRGEGGKWELLRRTLGQARATSVIAREGVILVGTEDGVHRSEDIGETWTPATDGLDTPHIRWLSYHPEISDIEYAGTEPANIFVSKDGGGYWEKRPEVAEMREKFGWHLPYSPEAGAVRGFAIHGDRIYAAVEDGCVLVSDNQGDIWRLAEGSMGTPYHNPSPPYIHSDVHSIEVHPSSRELVYAPTGGGFFTSEDGGESWQAAYTHCYCRACWVHPGDPQFIVLGPADGVDRNGRVELTRDGGRTWESASRGLETPWPNSMVERFVFANDHLQAILNNGDVYTTTIDSMHWERILQEAQGVAAIAFLEA